jgi:uncharacterized membrane protein YccF (DUF307 family)
VHIAVIDAFKRGPDQEPSDDAHDECLGDVSRCKTGNSIRYPEHGLEVNDDKIVPGVRLDDGDRYCDSCGTPFPAADTTESTATVVPAAPMPPAARATHQVAPVPKPQHLMATPPPPLQPVHHHVTIQQPSAPPASTIILRQPKTTQHAFIVRALWFLLVGWWLSYVVIALGYLLILFIITAPIGVKVLNVVPQALTLRQRTRDFDIVELGSVTSIQYGHVAQRPFWQRALYFIFIGWWFGAIWATVGWLFCVLILTFPLGVWMLNRIGAVISLHRH